MSIERVVESNFSFASNFKRKCILLANRRDPDQTPHSAVSELGLHCLSMSHRKDARLISIWVNNSCPNFRS